MQTLCLCGKKITKSINLIHYQIVFLLNEFLKYLVIFFKLQKKSFSNKKKNSTFAEI